MRVLSGAARGIELKTVPDMETRPILDRLKKSLFSILDAAGLLCECRVLDLYSGTGTLGIEALSRGASFCIFVERRPEAVKLLHENLTRTRLATLAEVRKGDVGAVLRILQREREHALQAGNGPSAPPDFSPYQLILYDPPFAFSSEASTRKILEAELAVAGQLLAPSGRLVWRAEKKTAPPQPEGLTLARHWTDGPHALGFYARG